MDYPAHLMIIKKTGYMTTSRKWYLGLGLVLGAAVLAGVAVAVATLVPSDKALAIQATAALEAATGVPVSVGAVHWQLLPRPAVTVENILTQQSLPVKISKITVRPRLMALLQKRLKFDSAVVDGAVVPQVSLRGLTNGKPVGPAAGSISSKLAPANQAEQAEQAEQASSAGTWGAWVVDELPLSQLVFRDVSWISRTGVATIFSGTVDFDTAWRPRSVWVQRPDAKAVTDLSLTRKGAEDRWDALAHAGGGVATGELELLAQPNGRLRLAGQLKFEGIEVASAVEAFNRPAVLAGKASGVTTIKANGANAAELAQSLHTQTLFSLAPATLLLFDLSKAVRTMGRQYNGQTPLDKVSGQLDAQNTADGMVINFSKLKASSGVLSASGQVQLLNRVIDAEVSVDLLDGVVGVPLKITGPLNQVKVSVANGVIAGAVVGTAVLPGVGTAIGARLGAAISSLLGGRPSGP